MPLYFLSIEKEKWHKITERNGMRELTYHNILVNKRPKTNVERSLGNGIRKQKAAVYSNTV